MVTRRSKCSQTGDLNLQEGAIFSHPLNDNRRMIMTGLCFIYKLRFSNQNVCFNNFIVKYKPERNRNLEKTNRTVSSELWVTDLTYVMVFFVSTYCRNLNYPLHFSAAKSMNYTFTCHGPNCTTNQRSSP